MFSQNFNNFPGDLSNYDILLRKHVNNHVEIMSFGDHIGNRRFQVLIELHRQAYNMAMQRNDAMECERILEKVAHTICFECVPRGRFLEQDMSSQSIFDDSTWSDLGNGPLVRERIRRGFLGLLFTLPIERNAELPSIPVVPEKKRTRVNLSDERFIVQGVTPRKAKRIKRKKTDAKPISQSSIVEVPASQILGDDILFGGKNGDEILLRNHLGNDRLQQIINWRSRGRSYSNNTDEQFTAIAREIIHQISSCYPRTRFLRKFNENNCVQMDVNTVVTKMATAIRNAMKFFLGNDFSKSNNESVPRYGFSYGSSEVTRPNSGNSRAA